MPISKMMDLPSCRFCGGNTQAIGDNKIKCLNKECGKIQSLEISHS